MRVMTGQYHQPFSECSNIQFDFQIIIQVAKSNLRPTIPEKTPVGIQNLITSCWDADIEKRPTVTGMIEIISRLKEYHKSPDSWTTFR